MVTKQQQLRWLAKSWTMWPKFMLSDSAAMSQESLGEHILFSSQGYWLITRQEWQQERDKMNSKPEVDNSWYDRGELPPVRRECEMKHKCWDEFQRVFVLAITSEYVIVSGNTTPAREQHYHLRDITFRPVSTEREKAIDEMKSLCAYPGSWNSTYKSFAEALYAAGYRKVAP